MIIRMSITIAVKSAADIAPTVTESVITVAGT